MTINKAIDLIVAHREHETTGELNEALALSVQALLAMDAMISTWGKLSDSKKGGNDE